MRKNQKYTREQMYQAIERCKQEELSHMQYCQQAGINYQSFKFWVKKYKQEKVTESTLAPTFMPVQVVQPLQVEHALAGPGYITITYPNGIQVSCPVSVPIDFLKILLKP